MSRYETMTGFYCFLLCHFTKHIKTIGKGTDNSPLFRIFALTITILYELRLNNESKNTDYAWRHRSSPI